MFNIFNNLSTLYNSYKKKPQDLYSGPISSVYKSPVTNGAPRSQMVGGRSVSTTGSTKAPQSYPMPSVNRTTPPPSTPPPTVKPPVAQPTAQQTYEQKYNNYLAQSQARKEQLAQQNEAEAKMKAQEEYDANKTSLTASKGNLDTMMSGFRQRAATGQARLDTQAQQNRDRTNVTAGENQRQLAIDRRDARNDNEKRYAALGTIDSMGTGSFQSANENTESDFLSLTAKNKQATQTAIQDIDNKLFDAKASSEERIATEESKYNDAILEIEKLLAGNETGKAQAIRAASQLLAQKKAEIQDEYEGLRITSEKERYDLQAKLEAAAMDDQKLREIFKGASPEFLTTGQPKTAQDQFIIFKYPKEAQAYQELLGGGKMSGEAAKTTSDLRSELFNRSKENNYTTVSQYIKKIDTAPDTAAGDMSMIFSYMKLLDPNSTVREGEYANAQNATSVPGQVQNAYNQALAGRRLNPTQRTQFVESAKAAAQPAIDQQKQLVDFYNTQATNAGVNPSDVSGMYDLSNSSGDGGRVRVIDIKTGQTGTIEAGEFDPNIYKKI